MPISGGTLYDEPFEFDHSNLTLLRINRGAPDRAAGEVKVVYRKNTKWLLLNPNQRQKFTQ
jgi:hypothetical protein